MKEVVWVGNSKEDLAVMPTTVIHDFGYALFEAQMGGKNDKAKPLQGFRGAGVLEIVENHVGDTYRAVYTVRMESAIYVLHCFQKKSKQGIATSQKDLDLIRARLKLAEEMEKERNP